MLINEVNATVFCDTCHKPKAIMTEGLPCQVPVMCDCEAKAYMERQQQQDERRRLQGIRARIESGIPPGKYRQYTFANDDRANPTASDAVKKYVDEWAENLRKGKGLLLCGGVGSGKTFLAVAAANEIVKQSSVYVSELSTLARDAGDFNKDIGRIIENVGLLVIDDIGVERSSEYVMENAYAIINGRYKTGLPVICTTNLSPRELVISGTSVKARIYDRILEMCGTTIVVDVKVSRRIRNRGKV
jgi:DNA replication protein DnaC